MIKYIHSKLLKFSELCLRESNFAVSFKWLDFNDSLSEVRSAFELIDFAPSSDLRVSSAWRSR